jgi:Holliday junction resolvase-like predicted endonuclease
VSAIFRTAGGEHEVDLIVERDDGCIVAVEVKLAATPTDNDVRHLLWVKGCAGALLGP